MFSITSFAAISLPTNLSFEDRTRVTEVLGLGTSSRLISDPYPLGGYSGVEIGVSVEHINTEDIGRLGATTRREKDFNYGKISVGKGLYNNLDMFLHFIPYTQNTGFSEYGGILRYCFHQAAFIPASFSVLIHANSANVGNVFLSQSMGIEFVAGLNVSSFAMYVGGGPVGSTAQFSREITSSRIDESNTINQLHTFVGGTIDIEPYFIALQIDQYTQAVYNGKLGVRF
ncbi:MAG: hypothetical protein AB7F59_14515 [Bdellovibrionales bacterium]